MLASLVLANRCSIAALVVPLVLIPSPTAHAAAPMCQGEEATIVDTTGTVMGTDGDDVIIGGERTLVRALAGRDKICVQGGRVHGGADRDKVLVVGTNSSDYVKLRSIERIDARLGAGGDSVEVIWNRFGGGRGSIDVGAGDDFLYATAKRNIHVDLADELLEIDGRQRYVIRGFEGALVAARVAKVSGDSGPNELYADSCRLRMSGGAGADVLTDSSNIREGEPPCAAPSKRMDGQGGDDFLWGDKGSETLIGGPGRDRADGGEGLNDRCVAEREFNCER